VERRRKFVSGKCECFKGKARNGENNKMMETKFISSTITHEARTEGGRRQRVSVF
jgi:hypothetical protein